MELGLHQLQKKTSSDISTTTFKIIKKSSGVIWMQVILAIFRKNT